MAVHHNPSHSRKHVHLNKHTIYHHLTYLILALACFIVLSHRQKALEDTLTETGGVAALSKILKVIGVDEA